MVDRIFKHELPSGNYMEGVTLELTKHARTLHVGLAGGKVCLWEQHNVDDENDEGSYPRTFIVVGTGVGFQPSENCRLLYIGTVVQPTSVEDFVWHVYEQAPY